MRSETAARWRMRNSLAGRRHQSLPIWQILRTSVLQLSPANCFPRGSHEPKAHGTDRGTGNGEACGYVSQYTERGQWWMLDQPSQNAIWKLGLLIIQSGVAVRSRR